MGALESLRRADLLLREGRSDAEVEALAGVTLAEILSLRARMATAKSPTPWRDRFTGRRLWK